MKISNISTKNFNESYQVTGDLILSYDGHKQVINCVNGSDYCEIEIPNGSGAFELPVLLQQQKGNAMVLIGIVFYNGKIFRSKNGLLFDKDVNRCFTLEDAGLWVYLR